MKVFVFVGMFCGFVGLVQCDVGSLGGDVDNNDSFSRLVSIIKNKNHRHDMANNWREFCLKKQSEVEAAGEEFNVQQYAEDSFAKGAIKGGQNSLVVAGLLALPLLRTRLAAPAFFFGAALSGAYTFAKCGSIDEPCAQRMSYYSQFDPKDAQGLSSISEIQQERYLNGQVVGGFVLTGLLATRMFCQVPRVLRAILFGVGR